ncbi:hypothetical protein [Bradyrhizobium sp. S3.7.6]
MSQNNQAQQRQQDQQRRSVFAMPGKRDEDEYSQSYVAMLNVMRRLYDLYGDPAIGEIITKAERALGRSR